MGRHPVVSGTMLAVALLLSTLLAGCTGYSPCTQDRLEISGEAPGLWAGIIPAPADLAPGVGMGLEPWRDGDAWVEGHILSGRPWRIGEPERMFALWYGEADGGVLAVWQEDGVEVQVYADDDATRDRLLEAVRDAVPPADWSAATRQHRDAPYFHDLAGGPPVPDPWVLPFFAGAVTPQEIQEQPIGPRHLGWWAWGLSPERSVRLAADNGWGLELGLGPEDELVGQVRGRGDESELQGLLEGFLSQWNVEPKLDGARYVKGRCDLLPPET